MISDNKVLGCSGFTSAGYPKEIPVTLAKRINRQKLDERVLKVSELDIFGNVNSPHVLGSKMMNGIGGDANFAEICMCPFTWRHQRQKMEIFQQ